MGRYRNQFIIGISTALLVVVGVLSFFNTREMVEKLDVFPIWLFGPILFLKFTNWAFRYWEWHYFLKVIGVKIGSADPSASKSLQLSRRDSILIWVVGLPTAVSPGKIGEVLKSIILKTVAHVPVSASAPVVFAERLVDGIAVIILVAISGIAVGDSFFRASGDISAAYLQGVLVIAVGLMMAVILIFQFQGFANHLLSYWHKLPILGRLQDTLITFYKSSYEITKLKHLVPTVGMGIAGYTADGIIFYLILLGLGIAPSGTLLGQSIFILGFSVIVAALSAMPGGAGGRELTVGALTSAVVGLSDAALGVAVLLVGFFQIWFGTLLGLIVIAMFRRTLLGESVQAEIERFDADTSPAIR